METSPGRYQSDQVHSATLKGKINNLEEVVTKLNDELNYYKKEVSKLRLEKESIDKSLTDSCVTIRKDLQAQVISAEDEMKKNYVNQKNENKNLQNQINVSMKEKTALQQ